MNEKLTAKLGRYKFELILIGIVFIIVIIQKLYFSNLSYKSGLAGNCFYYFEREMGMAGLFALLAVTVIVAFIALMWIIYKSCRTRKAAWPKILLLLIPFLVLAVLITGGSSQPGAVDFLRGYEKWVQKEVDIVSIQKWLESLDATYSGQRYFEAEHFPGELPEAVKRLKPYHVYFSEFKPGKRSVEFEWGSALGHWGIIIGLPGMETPEEGCIKITESLWEYRRPIQSGVYIFDRG